MPLKSFVSQTLPSWSVGFQIAGKHNDEDHLIFKKIQSETVKVEALEAALEEAKAEASTRHTEAAEELHRAKEEAAAAATRAQADVEAAGKQAQELAAQLEEAKQEAASAAAASFKGAAPLCLRRRISLQPKPKARPTMSN